MKTTDKLLIGIVGGIVLLVVVALVLTLTRKEAVYGPDDTPEGVAHNYLLAFQKEEYDRAYSYLSPTVKAYPRSVAAFVREVNDYSWLFRLDQDVNLVVESSRVTGNFAFLEIRETTFYGADFFDSGTYTRVFDMEIELEADGKWRITDADYYFSRDWRR